MIHREQALQRTPRRAPWLLGVLVIETTIAVGTLAWNAWEYRHEISNWLRSD